MVSTVRLNTNLFGELGKTQYHLSSENGPGQCSTALLHCSSRSCFNFTCTCSTTPAPAATGHLHCSTLPAVILPSVQPSSCQLLRPAATSDNLQPHPTTCICFPHPTTSILQPHPTTCRHIRHIQPASPCFNLLQPAATINLPPGFAGSHHPRPHYGCFTGCAVGVRACMHACSHAMP